MPTRSGTSSAIASENPRFRTPQSAIREAVREEKAYRVGTPPGITVKLNQNESPFDLPADLKQELVEHYFDVPFNRYPEDQPSALMTALGAALGHPAEGFIVGNGSNELTHLLGLAFMGPGRPVVLPRPMFSLYTSVVRLFESDLIEVPARPDWQFDADALEAAIRTYQPPLTVITTPNNPTGLAMPFADVERLVAAADGVVVVDEAYHEFNPEPSATTLLPTHPNLLVMRTFSKAYGLAGLRLGYLMGDPALIHELMKARLPFMIDHFCQHIALALLNRPDLLAERIAAMQASRTFLADALRQREGVAVVPSHTNFVLFQTPRDPAFVIDELAAQGVLIRNMGGYAELRGYLRVNAGTDAENRTFLAALDETLHTHTGS